MEQRIRDAIKIVEKRQGSDDPIPAEILQTRRALPSAPSSRVESALAARAAKASSSFVIWRGPAPVWRAPSAFNISGASLGAQFGFLVDQLHHRPEYRSRHRAVSRRGQDQVGRDGQRNRRSATPAPKVRSTRNLEKRDVLVYRDSGGLFGGATFGGSSIEVKNGINQDAYGDHIHVRDIIDGTVPAATRRTPLRPDRRKAAKALKRGPLA